MKIGLPEQVRKELVAKHVNALANGACGLTSQEWGFLTSLATYGKATDEQLLELRRLYLTHTR
jgi:hypothetical protein